MSNLVNCLKEFIRPGNNNSSNLSLYETADPIFLRCNNILFFTSEIAYDEHRNLMIINMTEPNITYEFIENNCIEDNELYYINKKCFYYNYHTNNYLHFVRDNICHLALYFKLKKTCKELKLLMFEKDNIPTFVSEYLELLGIHDNDIITVPKKRQVVVKNIVFYNSNIYNDKYKPFYACFDKFVMDNIYNKIYNDAIQFNPTLNLGKYIYISRVPKTANNNILGQDNTTTRQLLNEKDLIDLLSIYEFVSVRLEDYSLYEKIQILNNALVVIYTQGAGVIHNLFMHNTRVIVFNSEFYKYDKNMLQLDDINNLDSNVQNLYVKTNRSKNGNPNQPWTIDLPKVQKFMENEFMP